MDLSRPAVPTNTRPVPANRPVRRQRDRLVDALNELESILSEIERLKRLATSSEDWRVLMLYIATQKPRVSQLGSYARRSYAEEFAEAYDAQFANVGSEEKPPTARTAEIRAKRDAGLSYEVSERFDRTWKDLEALTWACKDIASSLDHQELEAALFQAYPDHLFETPQTDAPEQAATPDTENRAGRSGVPF